MNDTERELLKLRVIRKVVQDYLMEKPEIDPDEAMLTIDEILCDPLIENHAESYYSFPIVATDDPGNNAKRWDVV